jgi:hypothetical protein
LARKWRAFSRVHAPLGDFNWRERGESGFFGHFFLFGDFPVKISSLYDFQTAS